MGIKTDKRQNLHRRRIVSSFLQKNECRDNVSTQANESHYLGWQDDRHEASQQTREGEKDRLTSYQETTSSEKKVWVKCKIFAIYNYWKCPASTQQTGMAVTASFLFNWPAWSLRFHSPCNVRPSPCFHCNFCLSSSSRSCRGDRKWPSPAIALPINLRAAKHWLIFEQI